MHVCACIHVNVCVYVHVCVCMHTCECMCVCALAHGQCCIIASCGSVRQAVYSARETTWTSQQLWHYSDCFSEHLPTSHPPLRAVLTDPLTDVDLSGLASCVVALIFAWFWFCLPCCCSNICLVLVLPSVLLL